MAVLSLGRRRTSTVVEHKKAKKKKKRTESRLELFSNNMQIKGLAVWILNWTFSASAKGLTKL